MIKENRPRTLNRHPKNVQLQKASRCRKITTAGGFCMGKHFSATRGGFHQALYSQAQWQGRAQHPRRPNAFLFLPLLLFPLRFSKSAIQASTPHQQQTHAHTNTGSSYSLPRFSACTISFSSNKEIQAAYIICMFDNEGIRKRNQKEKAKQAELLLPRS